MEPPSTIIGVASHVAEWCLFKKRFWHLLDEESRCSYDLDSEDGIMPPKDEGETESTH
jgi:hypothetical protein